jgi:ribonuclease HII
LKRTRRAASTTEDMFAAYEADPFSCGVDEAGRGPLAGPVCAAAVILAADRPIEGVADSKTLDADTRTELAIAIKTRAVAWAIAFASVKEIDRYNILRASLLAMSRAVRALSVAPRHALVDGNIIPKLGIPATAIVKGDSLVPAISAASILAKTARDALMIELDGKFPHYGFAQHKGYATAQHLAALQVHGACSVHRRSFAPVKTLFDGQAVQLDMADSAW